MEKQFQVKSRLGTEYTVQPIRLEDRDYYVVIWKSDDGLFESDIQAKETVMSHISEGKWTLRNLV